MTRHTLTAEIDLFSLGVAQVRRVLVDPSPVGFQGIGRRVEFDPDVHLACLVVLACLLQCHVHTRATLRDVGGVFQVGKLKPFRPGGDQDVQRTPERSQSPSTAVRQCEGKLQLDEWDVPLHRSRHGSLPTTDLHQSTRIVACLEFAEWL